eukprot:4967776-Prymnesium_polylepis.1
MTLIWHTSVRVASGVAAAVGVTVRVECCAPRLRFEVQFEAQPLFRTWRAVHRANVHAQVVVLPHLHLDRVSRLRPAKLGPCAILGSHAR